MRKHMDWHENVEHQTKPHYALTHAQSASMAAPAKKSTQVVASTHCLVLNHKLYHQSMVVQCLFVYLDVPAPIRFKQL